MSAGGTLEVRNKPEANRFEAWIDNELAGFAQYRLTDTHIVRHHRSPRSDRLSQGPGRASLRAVRHHALPDPAETLLGSVRCRLPDPDHRRAPQRGALVCGHRRAPSDLPALYAVRAGGSVDLVVSREELAAMDGSVSELDRLLRAHIVP